VVESGEIRWTVPTVRSNGLADNFTVLRHLSRVGLRRSPVRVILTSRVYCLTSRQAIVRPPAPNQQPPLNATETMRLAAPSQRHQ
jgi:hypothetical protein